MSDAESGAAAPPAKSEKKRSFTVTEKLKVVEASKTQSLRSVARQYNVDRNCVRAWRDKEAELLALHPTAKRLPGAGRRPSTGQVLPASAGSKHGTERTPINGNESKKHKTEAKEEIDETQQEAAMTVQEVQQPIQPAPLLTNYVLVGFQGKEGAFSEVAAKTAFEELRAANALTPNDFMTVGFSHMNDVMEAVERNELAFGVLPVENSISGTFHGNLDRLVASHLKIVGEVACVQELCLCVLPGVAMSEIKQLSSHPAVLDHCESYICAMERRLGRIIERNAAWDSAGACQTVKQEEKRHVAAIASEQAAHAHGLVVLERGVGDELNSETRYMILGKLDATPLPLGASPRISILSTRSPTTTKSSIVVAVPNEPQALFKIVSAFALRNVMIVKIESRPAATAGSLFTAQTTHWDYIFYIDYITSQDATQDARLQLIKGAYGLGIYFAAAGDASHAIVDTRVPFYRLPSGALAPGEASGAIKPGDMLLSVNDSDVSSLRFPQIVDQLRQVPRGPVTLVFQRQKTSPETQVEESEDKKEQQNADEKERPKGWTMFQRLSASAAAVTSANSMSVSSEATELEGKLREMEATLAREQKCRFLAERKNVLYRNELLRVSQENSTLRDQLAQLKLTQKRRDIFATESLHLAI
ncbi:Arogenate dehydratase/prephenate dehydratase 1 [Phytophthora nicotianae]|uniref:Arogenate dehydratase/prephenate dehydratase 1 n=1 Tax=Phytophthora nicotianae TaxID=4792 RepID=A0A0W8CVN4_PHYNI|nr:Arogenate dehydratase/prephenate dehydratase 1 [Phytophthora nicotianae]